MNVGYNFEDLQKSTARKRLIPDGKKPREITDISTGIHFLTENWQEF